MATRVRWLLIRSLIAVASGIAVPHPRVAAQELPIPASFSVPAGAASAEGETRGWFEDPVETDRDSFTPSTRTAGRHRLILESAYSFIDNRGVPETHSFPELLLRYGAGEFLELRLGWNYEVGGGGSEVSGSEAGDFLPPEGETLNDPGLLREHRVTYGLKAALTEQKTWVPESAFIVQGFTPTRGESTATEMVATYVFGWELPNRWKADAAVRYGTGSEGGDRFGTWAPSAVLKVPLGERWNVHGEYFGLFSQDKAEDTVRHYFSPGVHFLVTPDLEVGVRVGWGLNDQSARFFCNTGLGWRF
jgi:hypothetical protein